MNSKQIIWLAFLLAGQSPSWAAEKEVDPAALKAENSQLRMERDALEAQVRILQIQLEESRLSVVNIKMELETLEFRCRKLQEELKLVKMDKKEAAIQTVSRPKPQPAEQGPKPANDGDLPVNPQGKITAISANGRMMQISIGAETGIKKGQLLEVFRLGVSNPKERVAPLYLGTLTLIRIENNAALGHFQSAPGFERHARVGDEVAAELFVK